MVFVVVGRIPDAMLQLVYDSNHLLIQYKVSIFLTSSDPIPKKVTFMVIKGASKYSHVVKMKSTSKPKVNVDKDVSENSVKVFLRSL